MANHNWITKCNQYVAHRDVKVTRRTAREEIDFGFETLKELQELEIELGPNRASVGNKYCFEDCITYDGEFYYLGKEIYTGIRGNEVW